MPPHDKVLAAVEETRKKYCQRILDFEKAIALMDHITGHPTNSPKESMTKEIDNQGGTPTDMRQIFANLKNVVSTEWNPDAPAVFDEFVREHEWELALHVVCDYLLEPVTPPAAPELLEEIQSLHKAMGIEDSCVTDLRRKAGQ